MTKSERDMWNKLKEPAPVIDEYGDKYWRNNAGELHRENDLPAVIWKSGYKEWWVNGKRHRENDLPVVISSTGRKEWWANGKFIKSDPPR